MIPKIILTDGTEIECNFCGVSSSGVIYIDLVGMSITKAVTTFSTKEKVSKIIYKTVQEQTEYDNFTVLVGVFAVQNLHGVTRVAMRKPYVGEV